MPHQIGIFPITQIQPEKHLFFPANTQLPQVHPHLLTVASSSHWREIALPWLPGDLAHVPQAKAWDQGLI